MADKLLRTRAATGDDVARMAEIESPPHTRQYLGVIGREVHELALSDEDQEQIVAEVDGAVVGFALLAGLCRGGGRIELRRIVIADSHRGTGYGRLLFRAAVARAYQRHRARQVWLDVKPDNAVALTLYASEGFVREGLTPDPMDPSGQLLVLVHSRPGGLITHG